MITCAQLSFCNNYSLFRRDYHMCTDASSCFFNYPCYTFRSPGLHFWPSPINAAAASFAKNGLGTRAHRLTSGGGGVEAVGMQISEYHCLRHCIKMPLKCSNQSSLVGPAEAPNVWLRLGIIYSCIGKAYLFCRIDSPPPFFNRFAMEQYLVILQYTKEIVCVEDSFPIV